MKEFRPCTECVYFVSCESGKQFFHAMFREPCNMFKDVKETVKKTESDRLNDLIEFFGKLNSKPVSMDIHIFAEDIPLIYTSLLQMRLLADNFADYFKKEKDKNISE